MSWNRAVWLTLCVALAGGLREASAVTLEQVSESTPWTGVTWRHYTTTSPTTHTWVALVDLCASRVHVTSTKAPSGTKSTESWAKGQGVQVATNGDFYKTGPVRVYGDAAGEGVHWPSVQLGTDAAYGSEWYFKKYGWIAFGHDWVDFTHTKQTKKSSPAATQGWKAGTVAPPLPPGTLSVVSGFPELVVEGAKVTCSSPTASTCFPDRSDMRDRHPRTAMGLTKDRKTFILAVVDGRTSKSVGMYGTELADLMAKLGAWEAFNLDGGGSSQLYVAGKGTINDASGNNNGGGLRAVANHWGIFAGTAGGKGVRPGHCVASAPCGVVPAGGGIVDDADPCFETFGPPDYWRTESAGYDGGLHWTNAFKGSAPSNWAWWQLALDQAGTYRVEVYGKAPWAKFAKTRYGVRAAGKDYTVTVDQAKASGWLAIGEWSFASGGSQWLAVYDDASGTVAAEQHIVADAIRLVRLDPWCGDGVCNGAESCGGCSEDCGACPSCGDGACGAEEGCDTCAPDCGSCPPACGDGVCDAGEGCSACPTDCGACPASCGDGVCGGGEACTTCPADCGACDVCGDGECGADEGCAVCPVDCGACAGCGDGECGAGEGCGGCPADCGPCPVDCGDGECGSAEGCASCPVDCGSCPADCGDGECGAAEGCASCPVDCGSCPGGGDAGGWGDGGAPGDGLSGDGGPAWGGGPITPDGGGAGWGWDGAAGGGAGGGEPGGSDGAGPGGPDGAGQGVGAVEGLGAAVTSGGSADDGCGAGGRVASPWWALIALAVLSGARRRFEPPWPGRSTRSRRPA